MRRVVDFIFFLIDRDGGWIRKEDILRLLCFESFVIGVFVCKVLDIEFFGFG